MRKIVVTVYMSLDGVVENPAWTVPYWHDDIAKFKHDELFASDILLFGRVTYDGFAQLWPHTTDKEGFADRMNSIPKYVVSTTLQTASWNNSHIIKTDAIAEIIKLKEQDGGNLLVYGSTALTTTLMKYNLVDDYWLLVYPVVLGIGKRLFQDGSQVSLKFVEHQLLHGGVVSVHYQPAGKE